MRMSRMIIIGIAVFAIAISTSVWHGSSIAYGDDSHPSKQQSKKPKVRPGFSQQGEMTFEVTLPPGQDSVTTTVDGPYGPMTVTVTGETVLASTGSNNQVVTAAATEYSRSCKSQYWFGISARFTIYQSFRYNYSSVTWMGTTTYSDFAVPAYFWSGQTVWKDWSSGWQYAWANGRATLKWGVGWLATSVGNVHNNILVDAWGNCTAKQTFKWF